MPLIRNTRMARDLGIKRSKEIKMLQAAVMAELAFDTATAFTVNKLEVVPEWLNIGLHWLFYVSIVTLVTAFFAYFMRSLQNREWLPGKKKMVICTYVLGCVLITASMPWIYFVKGIETNYSYGLPVFVCFTMVAAILSMLAVELKTVWREISRLQRGTAVVLFVSLFVVALVQAVFPEMLISALVPTLVIMSASMNMEDPQMIYQQQEREKIEAELNRINELLSAKKETPQVVAVEAESETAEEPLVSPLKLILGDIPYINTDGTLLYAEAEGNYINVVYFDGEKVKHHQVRQTMKQIAIILSDYERLMRVHRAYIVNLDMVTHVAGNSQGYQLTLSHTQQQVPVSRTYIAGFQEAFSSN